MSSDSLGFMELPGAVSNCLELFYFCPPSSRLCTKAFFSQLSPLSIDSKTTKKKKKIKDKKKRKRRKRKKLGIFEAQITEHNLIRKSY